jgi:hypothetical protein
VLAIENRFHRLALDPSGSVGLKFVSTPAVESPGSECPTQHSVLICCRRVGHGSDTDTGNRPKRRKSDAQ